MGDRLLASTRKGLFVLHRNGTGWGVERTAFLGDNVTLALADRRDGTWYAALNLGHFGVKLRRSTDHGRSWEECAVPEYRAGDVVPTADGKEPRAAALFLLWALEAGGADQPGRLWAGTIPGGLFRSDDGAKTWRLVTALWERAERLKWFGGGYDQPGIHSVCVDPGDPRKVRIAISCGGVWQTHDDGDTWECTTEGMYAAFMPPERRFDPDIQDPHRMVQCAGAPQGFWVQHHNAVFRSDDGARTWHDVANVPRSVFGFAVAVHPRDPGTAWFVPAVKDECRVPVDGELIVARTRDGGRSFDVLRNGLPQARSYDLVYRHGLAVDDSGEQLAFGSTTGGVWTSADGGDRWQSLPERLPPVYAMRFA